MRQTVYTVHFLICTLFDIFLPPNITPVIIVSSQSSAKRQTTHKTKINPLGCS